MSAGFTVPTLPSMREALALGLLTLCLGGARPAWSQEVTATITGSVVDPTGASIVGVNVRHVYGVAAAIAFALEVQAVDTI
jgi:hypothetical protein